MSQLKVNSIINLAGNGAPELSEGATLPSGKFISGSGGLSITGPSTVGILTATNVTANNITVTGSSAGLNIVGVCTASSFVGSAAGLTNIPAAGAYYFNTGLSSAVGVAVSNALTTVYTAPNTPTSSFLIQSIQVTNIDLSATSTVDASFYSPERFVAENIPVPPGASIELLKKPKVLTANQVLKLKSNNVNSLHATITIEEVLNNTTYVGAGITVSSSNTYTDLYSNASKYMAESLVLANVDSSADVITNVVWTNNSNVIQGYYVYNMIIPYGASVEILDRPKFLPAGFKIRVLTQDANRLNAVISARTLA
jgi:hypothetical protein